MSTSTIILLGLLTVAFVALQTLHWVRSANAIKVAIEAQQQVGELLRSLSNIGLLKITPERNESGKVVFLQIGPGDRLTSPARGRTSSAKKKGAGSGRTGSPRKAEAAK